MIEPTKDEPRARSTELEHEALQEGAKTFGRPGTATHATTVTVGEGPGRVTFAGDAPVVLIAGPCVIESEEHVLWMAKAIREVVGAFVFKASFDKANRSSVKSYRGPGLAEGLRMLGEVRKLGIPVLTDIHEPRQASAAAEVVDILQIPAFLCRQTDLLVEAGKTGRVVNIKKGQFVSPADFTNAADKVASTGNCQIILTERGSSFGYNNLVVDMRGLQVMAESGYPVVFDATHSVQLPGAAGNASSGEPQFIEPLARAATAVGIAGVFVEVHDAPERALSDGANALRLDLLGQFCERIRAIDGLVKGFKLSSS
jgi:2-dehydro-3-deoxyphosphooctonate aldolase (KDO 8-P synthase)